MYLFMQDFMKQKNKNKISFFKLLFYTFTMFLTVIYIIYRIVFTLPIKLGVFALIASILVLLVEVWESYDFFVYYINILSVNKKSPKAPDISNLTDFPDVDVLIATLNEPEALLEKTIIACKNMNYPDKSKVHIYVCDDGNRTVVKNLALKLDVNYISRLNNKNAKAGNYNHALSLINSPFVATFDADMAPTENFLLTTLPYFYNKSNKKIGFVQLPQSFRNPDIFQYRFGLANKIPFEQDYFYHSIQLAKNYTNSVVCCGTNTLFSREALDSTSGFATGTISEDIATGMLIEANGYKCLALDNVEAYGMATDDLTGFVKQRSRWARGCIQILKKFKIIGNKGLSLKQKMEYLSCISYWFFGVRRMIYLLTPLLFSLFGVIIVDCNLTTFISIWLPAYILKRFALDLMEDRKRSSTWNKIYETILTPVLFKEALKEFFGFGNTVFEVTPKYAPNVKMSKTNVYLLLSHLVLLVLNLAGLGMCIYNINQIGLVVYILPLVWLISNIFYLSVSVIFDLRFKPKKYNCFVPNKVMTYSLLNYFRK